MNDIWFDVLSQVVPRDTRIRQGDILAVQMIERNSGTKYVRLVARGPQDSQTILMEQQIDETLNGWL